MHSFVVTESRNDENTSVHPVPQMKSIKSLLIFQNVRGKQRNCNLYPYPQNKLKCNMISECNVQYCS